MKVSPRLFLAAFVAAAIGAAAPVQGQAPAQPPAAPSANPISDGSRMMFQIVSGFVTKSAEKAPEELYAFKPTPEVRTFGQLVGHTADSAYFICASAMGEKPPVEGIEKTKTTKADLVKALTDSVAYCQKAYGGLTDATAGEQLPFFHGKLARVTILDFSTAHLYEHYGNMVTYMRLKGIVPASSEKQPAGN
ncbi:MAG: DinB family protein [Acidobacteria bacterium]|nr:DinB family protein [Acidobacteriota bacterium]